MLTPALPSPRYSFKTTGDDDDDIERVSRASQFFPSIVDGLDNEFLRSVKHLAVHGCFCFLPDSNGTLERLRPLLKFKNLKIITWVTTIPSDASGWSKHRQRFHPNLPFSADYFFADPNEMLPFRNNLAVNYRETGRYLDVWHRAIKDTFEVDWKIPEILMRVKIPKSQNTMAGSNLFVFNGQLQYW